MYLQITFRIQAGVIGSPRWFKNKGASFSAVPNLRSAMNCWRILVGRFIRGTTRLLPPLPCKSTLAGLLNRMSPTRMPHNSCALAPLSYKRLSSTMSRRSRGFLGSGICSRTLNSSTEKYEKIWRGVFFGGILAIFEQIFNAEILRWEAYLKKAEIAESLWLRVEGLQLRWVSNQFKKDKITLSEKCL